MKLTAPQNALDEATSLASRLPWWASLFSAVAIYVVLYPVATLQLAAPSGMVDVVATSLGQLLVFLAQVAQYLLPLTFLIASAVSGFGSWKRSDLRDSVSRDPTGSILRGLPWTDFALLVTEVFRRQGYELTDAGPSAALPGSAFELRRQNRRYLVDCADWRSWKAGAGAVRKLAERIEDAGADGGFSVSSGQFTPEARHFVADRDIELIDGRRLKELVRAAPEQTRRAPSVTASALADLVAGWRARFSGGRRAAARDNREVEPSLSADPSGIRVDADAPAAANPTVAADRDAAAAASAGAELSALTALIRSERPVDDELQIAAPVVEERTADVTTTRSGKRGRRILTPRRLVDATGMLLAFGALWLVYEWFVDLPDAPANTPWALMGAGGDSAVLARRLEGLQLPGAGAGAVDRPLGQFQFGPAGTIAEMEAAAASRNGYQNLRELESAFDEKYVPPPECYAWESNDQMVRCGNHRIRARRDFVASGGEVSPAMLGSWEEPRPVITELRPQDWRHYEEQDWENGVDEQWGTEDGADRAEYARARGGWDPEPTVYELEELGDTHKREYLLEPDQDWQAGSDQGSRGGWERSANETPTRTAWDLADEQPRGADSGWESPGQWRRVPREEKPLEPQQDWRQEWLRGADRTSGRDSGRAPADTGEGDAGRPRSEDWRREWIEQPRQDAEQDWRRDWRQDWLQEPARDAEQDWSRSWDRVPPAVERRHWVDDL